MSLGNRFFSHLLGLLVLLTALPAAAEEEEDPLVAQATRQLELARSDLKSGAYERAVKACDSALRLDPTNREAFKIKGLALHKLDKLDDAQAMLMAYESLRSGLPPDPEVAEIMEKIRIKKALALQKAATKRVPVPAIIMVAAGGGMGAVGFALHGSAYSQASGSLDADAKTYAGTEEAYTGLYQQNVAGMVMGVAGVAVAGAGVALLLVETLGKKKGAEAALAPTPWLWTSPDGAAVGISGVLP